MRSRYNDRTSISVMKQCLDNLTISVSLARIILEESPQQLGAQLICPQQCAAAPEGAQCRTSRSTVADRLALCCIASGDMKAILA